MIYALDLRKARVKILGAKNIIKKLFDLFFKLTLRYQPALSGSGSFFSGYPIPRKKISIAGIKIFWIFGIFTRDFSAFSNPDPDPRIGIRDSGSQKSHPESNLAFGASH